MVDEAFGDYRLQRVYEQTTPELRQEIIDFWRRNHALPAGSDGQKRSHQVFYVARNADGDIIAVSTVYIGNAGVPPEPHYFYRMFIRSSDRQSGLAHRMMTRTRESLHAEYAPGKPKGLVVILENPALRHPAVQKLFAQAGYKHMGKSPKGYDIWMKRFADT